MLYTWELLPIDRVYLIGQSWGSNSDAAEVRLTQLFVDLAIECYTASMCYGFEKELLIRNC